MDTYTRRLAGSLGLTHAEVASQMKQATELHSETYYHPATERRARIEASMRDDDVPRTMRTDHQRTLDWS